MTRAGEGYRYTIGLVWWLESIASFLVAAGLLWWRRNLQPLKAYNPFLLALMLVHRPVGWCWIQFREMGWLTPTCGGLLWVAIVGCFLFSLPILIWGYRLVLIGQYEQRKIQFAKHMAAQFAANSAAAAAAAAAGNAAAIGTGVGASYQNRRGSIMRLAEPGIAGAGLLNRAGSTLSHHHVLMPITHTADDDSGTALLAAQGQALVQYHSNWRMVALVLVALSPCFVFMPIFLAFDTSTDWSTRECMENGRQYYNNSVICLALTAGILSLIGLRVQWLLPKTASAAATAEEEEERVQQQAAEDAFGIRWALNASIMYSNIFVVALIVLNIAWPEVNRDFIESGYCAAILSEVLCIHLVIGPALKTWSWQATQKKLLAAARHSPKQHKSAQSLLHGGGNSGGAHGHGGNSHQPLSPANSGRAERTGTITATSAGVAGGAARHTGGSHAVGSVVRSAGSHHSDQQQLMQQMQNHPLMKVLSDSDGYNRFLRYLQSEFAAESLLFWRAVNDFKNDVTLNALIRIYTAFVSLHSPLQVNISHECTESITTAIAPYVPPSILPRAYRSGGAKAGGVPNRSNMTVASPKRALVSQLQAPAAASAPVAGTLTPAATSLIPATGNATPPGPSSATPNNAGTTVSLSVTPQRRPTASPGAGGGSGAGAGSVLPGSVADVVDDTKVVDVAVVAVAAATGGAVGGSAGSTAHNSNISVQHLLNVFDSAQLEVFGVMASDPFPRFKLSALGLPCAHLWRTAGLALPHPPGAAAVLTTPKSPYGSTIDLLVSPAGSARANSNPSPAGSARGGSGADDTLLLPMASPMGAASPMGGASGASSGGTTSGRKYGFGIASPPQGGAAASSAAAASSPAIGAALGPAA